MPTSRPRVLVLATAVVAFAASARGDATFLGPTPYLSQADSPFALGTGTFCLEDFEDGLLDVPNVTGNGSVVGPGGLTDSVDGDDGTIDGSGTNGHSYFSPSGAAGITFMFDPSAPLGLPTNAGMVWTDGGFGDTVTFEAFDQNGTSLGTTEAPNLGDNSNVGTTAEDRFFGVENAGGISAIKLSNPDGGIEVDHLQFDHCGGVARTTTTSTSTTTSTVTTTSTSTSTSNSTRTSTTTVTTSTAPASTTSTLIVELPCVLVSDGPTFDSLNCRITALLADVQDESRLGSIQSQLVNALERAKQLKDAAESSCIQLDTKRAKKQLQQAAQKLAQFSHRLRSHSTKRKVPAEVREPFASRADAIKNDARTLAKNPCKI